MPKGSYNGDKNIVTWVANYFNISSSLEEKNIYYYLCFIGCWTYCLLFIFKNYKRLNKRYI
tara:strand:+ start:169 stop:351 length:183 start_codon:yes stop_codon:yes gene_type:complete